jgi:hypothetical protein
VIQSDVDLVAQIAELAQKAAEGELFEVLPVNGGNVGLLVPKTHDYKDLTKEVDDRLERLAPGPRRLIANETAETFEGYLGLTIRHAGKSTVVEALLRPSPVMTTYVDYHVASSGDGPEARRLQHSVTYPWPYSERLQAWLAAGSSWQTKREFMAFVQDRVVDLVSPFETQAEKGSVTRRQFEAVLLTRGKDKEERESAALEVLFGTPEQLFSGVVATKAISSIEQEDIESGFGDVVFSYKKIDKTDAKDRMREYYLVEIEVFEGEKPCVLPARFRARSVDGDLQMRLEVVGLRDVIKDSFEAAAKVVAEKTGLQVYRVKLGGKSS